MEKTKQVLNDVEAAQFLRLGVQTLRNWRTKRKGPPYVKISRCVRYRLVDLESYLASKLVDIKG